MVRERELIMLDELPRRTFFSALALSPLALLGLRKSEPKDEPHPYPLYGTWKKCAEVWEKTARHWSKNYHYWRDRALVAEKALKEAQAKIDETEAELDSFTYEPVPLEKVGTIQVRYKKAQSLKPLLWRETE